MRRCPSGLGCSLSGDPRLRRRRDRTARDAAASSTLCEGAASASDWHGWERAGRAPASGEGNGFGQRYTEDLALLAGLGLRHHRLSLVWARLEPEPGCHDGAAVAHYEEVLLVARDAGIEPWVCLHHFTLSAWFAAEGGFLDDGNRTSSWARHVEFVAERFGHLVAGWQPVNETNYYVHVAYGGGGWPPGGNDATLVAAAEHNIQLATAEAAVRLRQTARPVASIFGLSDVVAQDDLPETARRVEALYDRFWRPGLELFRDGVLRVGGAEPLDRPDLARSFDVFGFSYYATMGVAAGQLAVHPPGAPRSSLGSGIWADGLHLVLNRLHRELPGTPLLVAELGIGANDDNERAAYLRRPLAVAHDALDRGVDLRGLFHWTAVDSYEWLHGYDVSFGLLDREPRVRPSAAVLTEAARTGS